MYKRQVIDGLLIEVQTGNFSAIRDKIRKLIMDNRVRLVYPIAKLKWIVYVTEDGEVLRRRKSPKRGKLVDLFYELVYLPDLFMDRNFSFEVLFIEEEELRCNDGKGSWRKKGISTKDRRLLSVLDTVTFENRQDFLRFLHSNPMKPFLKRCWPKNYIYPLG